MDLQLMQGVIITPLKEITLEAGNILHGMKIDDPGFSGFGEVYFSFIKSGQVKGWKKHRIMTLNLIVPIGKVRFILYDDRQDSSSLHQFQEITLSRSENYCRLTVPPMLWMGFQGLGNNTGMLVNIANIKHSPNEVVRKNLGEISFDWEVI